MELKTEGGVAPGIGIPQSQIMDLGKHNYDSTGVGGGDHINRAQERGGRGTWHWDTAESDHGPG